LDQDNQLRAITLAEQARNLFFSTELNLTHNRMCAYKDIDKPAVWAKKNPWGMVRDRMERSMLHWVIPQNGLHAPLSTINCTDADKQKDVFKQAKEMHKTFLAWGRDVTKYSDQEVTMTEDMLTLAITNPELRVEMYLQMIKQLIHTPDDCPDKKRIGPDDENWHRAWKLFQVMLDTIEPPAEIQKYVAAFIWETNRNNLGHANPPNGNSPRLPVAKKAIPVCKRIFEQVIIVKSVTNITTASLGLDPICTTASTTTNRYDPVQGTRSSGLRTIADLMGTYTDPEVVDWELDLDDKGMLAYCGVMGGDGGSSKKSSKKSKKKQKKSKRSKNMWRLSSGKQTATISDTQSNPMAIHLGLRSPKRPSRYASAYLNRFSS